MKHYFFRTLPKVLPYLTSIFDNRAAIHGVLVCIVALVTIENIRLREFRTDLMRDRPAILSFFDSGEESDIVEEIVDFSKSSESSSSYFEDVLGAPGTTPSIPDPTEEISNYEEREFISNRRNEAINKSSRNGIISYVVKDGDTAWDIAAEFGIDVPTLLSANNLTERSIIRPGDSLTILPTKGLRHIVKDGETLSSIALRYKAEIQEIARVNKLTDSAPIHAGEILTIPGGSIPTPPAPPVKVARERRSEAVSPAERAVRNTPKPPASTASGNYVWPTSGRHITQYFGYRHTGIDVDGQIGSPIYAIADGTVEFSGWATGYGLSIVVNHGNGIWSRYGHNSKIYVKIGDTVNKGATIALMGTTGKSTGSHLHLEILTGTRKYQNPLKYIKR